jgi:hypothetical protein
MAGWLGCALACFGQRSAPQEQAFVGRQDTGVVAVGLQTDEALEAAAAGEIQLLQPLRRQQQPGEAGTHHHHHGWFWRRQVSPIPRNASAPAIRRSAVAA